ncbi:MAG: hypothetical protein NT003_02285 [Candidatus Magasanikbacteria bacterium]|nr:hypothetical protein [Candidatus Magasanikbacteria bacterium]
MKLVPPHIRQVQDKVARECLCAVSLEGIGFFDTAGNSVPRHPENTLY